MTKREVGSHSILAGCAYFLAMAVVVAKHHDLQCREHIDLGTGRDDIAAQLFFRCNYHLVPLSVS